jgi:hypothetical protein
MHTSVFISNPCTQTTQLRITTLFSTLLDIDVTIITTLHDNVRGKYVCVTEDSSYDSRVCCSTNTIHVFFYNELSED